MCNVPVNAANRNHQCFQCLSHLRKINKGKNYICNKRNMLVLKEIPHETAHLIRNCFRLQSIIYMCRHGLSQNLETSVTHF